MHHLQKHKVEAIATNESLILDCKVSAYLTAGRWLSWLKQTECIAGPLSLSLRR